ncbi:MULTISPECIES: SGNH/GDSL hydrolase family protein [unclassified Nodularia (in: cyanobacteria)]|uniref:SGNH/GDSL hydrolase family protein n=1 Tax=unclassified Nodularia (in: cyanobacteria) TaxID=2656917 RepID=UPI001881940A|nr:MULTISPECIES: SGNH/GDSL hydrolase family protein [unclassified Nodularia (in: cyanobacteria)]MBE9201736.1 phospholipase [Nodularia sp. LEGE 06071]MCC2691235.1 phospholipase [Nodularia sp. LEGE 04288]
MHSFTFQAPKTLVWLATLGTLSFSIGTFSQLRPTVALTIPEELTQITTEFNALLDQEISALNGTLSGSNISLMDANTLFADVLLKELTETNQSCVQGPLLAHAIAPTSICSDPENFLYYDEIHITTTVHSRIADIAIATLSPEVLSETTKLIVFGDSFSDVGNISGFSNGTFPFPVAIQGPLAGEPLYASGAFTNGLVWWQYLANQMFLEEPVPFYENVSTGTFLTSIPDEGINFAVGGATSGIDNLGNVQTPPFPIDLPGLQDQIEAFDLVVGEGGEADPDALYIVWAGANNFFGAFIPQDPTNPFAPFPDLTKDPTLPVSDISAAIKSLYALGARNFLVGNRFDLGQTPLAQELQVVNTPVPTSVAEPNQLAGIIIGLGFILITRGKSSKRVMKVNNKYLTDALGMRV